MERACCSPRAERIIPMDEQTPDIIIPKAPDMSQDLASAQGEMPSILKKSSTSPTHPLSIALSAAVPLHIHDLYSAGKITNQQLEEARAVGRRLAEQGDKF